MLKSIFQKLKIRTKTRPAQAQPQRAEADSLETVLNSFAQAPQVLTDSNNYIVYNINYGNMSQLADALSQRVSSSYQVVDLLDLNFHTPNTQMIVYLDINSDNIDDSQIVDRLCMVRARMNSVWDPYKVVFITNASKDRLNQVYETHRERNKGRPLPNTEIYFMNSGAVFVEYSAGQLVRTGINGFG